MNSVVARSCFVPMAVIAGVTSALAWIFTLNPAFALLPIMALAASYILPRVSIRWPVLILLLFALVVENPQARPMEDRWQSPLFHLGNALYNNLNNLTGVDSLRFCLFEVLIVVMAGNLFLRRVIGLGEEGRARLPKGTQALVFMLAISLATTIHLEIWGMARGGDLRQSLWQIRQILWLPIISWLCIYAFRGKSDLNLIAAVILISGVIRALFGFIYYGMCRLEGYGPAYITTHADSVLWTIGLIICMVALIEKPRKDTAFLFLSFVPFLSLALILNDRRLAFVCLGASTIVILIMLRSEVKRRVRKLILASSPILLIYALIGWNVEHKVFRPVRTLKSLLDDSDTSNHSRDVENFNLIFSALERPFLGAGFAHTYSDHIYTYRIDHVFEQYSYMPHNSVLWLLAVGGVTGFLGILGYLPLVVWLSTRAYSNAVSLSERIAAISVVAVVISYLIQAWGDMGIHSWMIVIVLSIYLGVVSNLDHRLNIWSEIPEHRPIACVGG